MDSPVAEIAKKIGGGGHPLASGFKVKGKMKKVVDQTINLIKETFK